MTVLENLIMAPMDVKKLPRAQAIERAELLLRKVGLLDKIDAYPSSIFWRATATRRHCQSLGNGTTNHVV